VSYIPISSKLGAERSGISGSFSIWAKDGELTMLLLAVDLCKIELLKPRNTIPVNGFTDFNEIFAPNVLN